VVELNEQQMRALEARAESLRHLSTVALTLAAGLATLAGTLLQVSDPWKVWGAAGIFLLCAFLAILGQEQVIGELEGKRSQRRMIMILTGSAQASFGMGWAMLIAQGEQLLR